MSAQELDAVAAELLALPPGDFTAARNARASAETDRALATAIRAIPKPSVAAWAVGLLVRDGGLADALELAAALREAQQDLDAPELQALSRQRRSLVAALAKQATSLAHDRGVTVSSAASGDVERTIDAAVRDAGAAAAVQSGRLVRTLAADGVDPVDLDGAVAGSRADGTAPPARDDLAERHARKKAEADAREAERAASHATKELDRLDDRLARERQRADHAAERITDLRADLARFEADLATAEEKAAALEKQRSAAASIVREADRAAERARAALARRSE